MRNNFVPEKCFLEMSESRHSDIELYYPGELSDAEMLQLPTHSEATERKSLLSKQSNAATRGLVPPKNENEKSGHMSEVGPDGKIFGSRSGRTDLAALSPYVLTSSQIFSRPALPLSQ